MGRYVRTHPHYAYNSKTPLTPPVGAIPPLGGFIGSILSGPLLHLAGRKRTVCIASPVGAFAWSLVALSPSWPVLIAGRLLCGCCVGLSLTAAQIYVTECTDARTRGVIGSLPSMAMSGGILASYTIGCFVRWDRLAWLGAAASLAVCAAVALLPESPVWLATTTGARTDRAHRSRQWLKLDRSGGVVAKSLEMEALNGATKLAPTTDQHEKTTTDDPHSMAVLLSPDVLRPLGVGLTLLLIQQCSGIDAVIFFTVDIFRASGSTIDGHVATIIVGALQLASNAAALCWVDRAGRKPLLVVSALVMAVAMALMGLAFQLNAMGIDGYG